MILYLLTEEGFRKAAELRVLKEIIDDEKSTSAEAAQAFVTLQKKVPEFQAKANEYRQWYERASHVGR